MPSINDRIGSQNVIRVLSNASAPPSRLINLTDVDSSSQEDGNLLIWDAGTSKFVMGRNLDGTEGYVFTGGTGQVGIVTFSGTTQSESTTTGAVIISGGLAVGKNANFAAGLNVVGIATFSNEIDINAAVDILRGLNVAGVTSVASLSIGSTQVISGARELQNITSLDATTTATIEAAIEVAPNTFTDLKISGVSTFIGIATYAAGLEVFTGVSTFNAAVDIDAGLDVDGQTDLDELVVAGVSTFSNTVDINAVVDIDGQLDVDELVVAGVSTFNAAVDIDSTLDVDGQTNLDELVVAGVSTYNALVDIDNRLDVTGGANLDQLNVAGITTLGAVDINGTIDIDGQLDVDELVVTGVSTFSNAVDINSTLDVDGDTQLDDLTVAGVATFSSLIDANNRLDVVGGANLDQLNVTGVSTLTGNVSFGTSAFFGDNDKINMGDNDDLQIYHASNGTGIIQNAGSGQLQLRSNTIRLLNQVTDEDFAFFRDDGAVELYYNNTKRFETSGIGVTVTGQLDSTTLNVSGISTLTGNVSFGSSALFGDGDTILMGDGDDLQIFHSGVTGNIKNTTGTLILQSSTVRIQDGGSSETAFSAADGVAQLYYKNSKKLETNGVGVTVYNQLDATNLNISGVSTFTGAVDLNAGLDIDGQLDVDELVVAGVSTFNAAVDINAGLDVDGQTDLDELVVAGVSTFNAAVDIDSTLDVDGDTQLDDLNVAGVATFSSLVDANNRLDVVGGANLDQLNVVGISTFNDDVRITAGGLDVVGVATFSTNVNVTGTLDAGLIDGGTY